ncbi:uncharacterized protein BJ212DRAFT_1383935 [Suillus subaureus]|uniref:Secreted protein n=1 Tax=Suillus subaureus TaxID=48587 RepID=A0A9P7J8K7_9AGAM|nr:uncharacterized protein BJ212DRAFT_1383935 [Suillus subaureus]KAG1808190.1 hypothetical protein BJ212DRAFT_1383935 [Suillus subaureus]
MNHALLHPPNTYLGCLTCLFLLLSPIDLVHFPRPTSTWIPQVDEGTKSSVRNTSMNYLIYQNAGGTCILSYSTVGPEAIKCFRPIGTGAVLL